MSRGDRLLTLFRDVNNVLTLGSNKRGTWVVKPRYSRSATMYTTSKKRYLVHLVSDTSAAFVRQPSGQACRPRSAHSNALCPIKKLEGVGSWRPETCSSRVDGLPETNSTSRWTCSMTTPAACSRCSFCSLQALRRCCSCWSV